MGGRRVPTSGLPSFSCAGPRSDALGHGTREAVQRRALPEDAIELCWIGGGDPRRVEVAQAVTQLQWPGEGLLDGHLLIEGEPHQQRKWIRRKQSVGFSVSGEMEAVSSGWRGGCGHGGTVRGAPVA